jgi:hypothetical protein
LDVTNMRDEKARAFQLILERLELLFDWFYGAVVNG